MDELELELVNDFVEESALLRERLVQALAGLPQEAAEAVEVLSTIAQRAGFIGFDSLERWATAMTACVADVAGCRRDPDAASGLLEAGLAALDAAVDQLRSANLGDMEIDELLEAMTSTAGDEEAPDLPPEAMVAIIATGPDEPLGAADGEPDDDESDDDESDDDEEAAVPAPSPAAARPAAAPASPAAVALETVEVIEGPVNAEVADFLPDFLTEAGEIIDALDEELVKLEDAGADLELLNQIFRAAHTLKGTSAFLGFAQMADLTHKMENVLDLLRKEELTLSEGIMDVILRGVDHIKVLLGDIRGGTILRRDLDDVRRDLVLIATTGTPSAPAASARGAAAPAPASAPPAAAPAAFDAPAAAAPARDEPTRRQPVRDAEQIIRVDVDRIDKIMTLAEELVLGRNRLLQLNSLLAEGGDDSVLHRLGEATGHVGMLTGELQEAVMTMRMIPASRVFSRFPRMVRDLARDLGKQIELVLEDNETEIDKSVADEIGDPLVHLIRNAVDHGVETPEARRAAGKDPRGTVVLSAAHEGNHIVIRITDDGHGMDPRVLRAKAVEKGVISEAEAARMSDDEAYNLIFAPGFSTAQQVTGVSGRGVGMDVVKTNISRLSGTIQLESTLGRGTEVTIRLPLTLAIIGGLQVAAGDEVYILPLTSVIEAVKIDADSIETVHGGKAVISRGKVLPLIDLADVLQTPRSAGTATQYVVIAGLAERRTGVLVDRLLGQVDVVIKALGDFVGPATGIAGATILGDGTVSLILDVADLMALGDDLPVAARQALRA